MTLVGVVHRDPFGEMRVEHLLEKLDVDCLSLEVSPYALEWRLENGLRLSGDVSRYADRAAGKNRNGYSAISHGEILGILEMLAVPFEVRTALKYAQKTGARYFLNDDSEVSRSLLKAVEEEMITPENIKNLISRPDFSYAGMIEEHYEQCSRYLEREPLDRIAMRLSEDSLEINEKRDLVMGEKLLSQMSDMPGNWVHICGFTHILRARGFANIAALFPEARRILALHYPGRSH